MKSADSRLSNIRRRISDTPEVVVLITTLIVFIFFSLRTESFFSAYAVSNFLTFGSIHGVAVIGVAFLMIAGEFDLSIGSTMAVAMYVLVLLMLAGVPALIAVLLALGVSASLGLINGLIVTNSKIPSFIVTLGTMLAYRGVARFIGQGSLMNYPMKSKPVLFNILNGDLARLNNLWDPPTNFRSSIFWFIGLTVVMTIVLNRTRFGNWAFASGGNAAAALAQGVNVKRIKVGSFMLSGLLAGFAGMLFFSHRLSVSPLTGNGSELLAVAACVIGGVRLTGGYGTIIGASIGIILMSMLEQGLASMGLAQEVFQAVTGLILILAMLANTIIGDQD